MLERREKKEKLKNQSLVSYLFSFVLDGRGVLHEICNVTTCRIIVIVHEHSSFVGFTLVFMFENV